MPIVGFNFDRINVEKKNPIRGRVQVKTDMAIKDVKDQELLMGKKKESVLKFVFKFVVNYQPDIGEIAIDGHVLFMEEPSEVKKIMSGWKKKKFIPPNLMTLLLNAVLVRCNVKALVLSHEVNLPPHIRLPTISPKSKASEYIG